MNEYIELVAKIKDTLISLATTDGFIDTFKSSKWTRLSSISWFRQTNLMH